MPHSQNLFKNIANFTLTSYTREFILPGITMYKSSTLMLTFSKLLLNFGAYSCKEVY